MPIGASFTLEVYLGRIARSQLVARLSAAIGRRFWAQTLVDLLAGWTYRELLWVASRNPLLPAKSRDRVAENCRLNDLVLLHVVRVALVITRLDNLLLFALQQGGVGCLSTDAAGTEVVLIEIVHESIIQVYGVAQSDFNLEGLATSKHGKRHLGSRCQQAHVRG